MNDINKKDISELILGSNSKYIYLLSEKMIYLEFSSSWDEFYEKNEAYFIIYEDILSTMGYTFTDIFEKSLHAKYETIIFFDDLKKGFIFKVNVQTSNNENISIIAMMLNDFIDQSIYIYEAIISDLEKNIYSKNQKIYKSFYILLDSSGSTFGEDIFAIQMGANSFLDQLKNHTLKDHFRGSIIIFSSFIDICCHFLQIDQLILPNLIPFGASNLNKALLHLFPLLHADTSDQKYILVFGDSETYPNCNDLIQQLKKDSTVKIFYLSNHQKLGDDFKLLFHQSFVLNQTIHRLLQIIDD